MALVGAQKMLCLLPCFGGTQSGDQELGLKVRAKGAVTPPAVAKSSMTGPSPQLNSSSSLPLVKKR